MPLKQKANCMNKYMNNMTITVRTKQEHPNLELRSKQESQWEIQPDCWFWKKCWQKFSWNWVRRGKRSFKTASERQEWFNLTKTRQDTFLKCKLIDWLKYWSWISVQQEFQGSKCKCHKIFMKRIPKIHENPDNIRPHPTTIGKTWIKAELVTSKGWMSKSQEYTKPMDLWAVMI